MKRRRTQKRTFLDLGPRIVINDILPFFELRLSETKNPYDYFGYFKADKLRNEWFVFSSVMVDAPIHEYYLNFKKLVSVELNLWKMRSVDVVRVIRKLEKESAKMILLECLVLSSHLTIVDYSIFNNLFSCPNCFPSLRKFEVRRDLLFSPLKLDLETNVFERVESVIFSSMWITEEEVEQGNVENIFKKLGKNVKNLELNHQIVPEKIDLYLEELKNLTLCRCRNIQVRTGEKLKSLRVKSKLTQEILPNVKAIYESSPNLECIDISIITEQPFFDNYWLLDPKTCNNLRKITLFGIGQMSSNAVFGEKIESVELFLCKHIEESIFLNEYPKMKYMHIEGKMAFNRPTCQWSLMKNIEVLFFSLSDFEVQCLLHLNEPEHLSELSIYESTSVFEETKLMKLKKLDLMGCVNLNDDFFLHSLFPVMKEMHLCGCDTLTGREWAGKNLECVEVMVVNQCQRFSDSFFREQDMKNLRELEIVLSPPKSSFFRITGTKWRSLLMLKKLEIHAHDDGFRPIQNEMFEKRSLKKLEDLLFGNSYQSIDLERKGKKEFKLGTKKWKIGMPNLRKFSYPKEWKSEFNPELLKKRKNKCLPPSCRVVELKKQ